MRSIIHAFKSITRNKVKTIMMFFMMFIVFNLIFSGIIIQNTISESKQYLRREMGGFVQYKIDYSSWWENVEDPSTAISPRVDLDVAKQISSSSYVKRLYILKTTYLNSDELESISTGDTGIMQDTMIMPIGTRLALKGINQAVPIDHTTGKVTLDNNQGFSEEQLETDFHVGYISKLFAEHNQLRVGDYINLSDYNENEYEIEIIGFYELPEGSDDFSRANALFVPNKLVDLVNDNDPYNTDDVFYGEVYFEMNDAIEVDDFREDVAFYLPDEYHILDANDQEFEKINAPLDLMELITQILVTVILVAGALITMSLITIFVRDRKFEIGLLITNGESKPNIFSQILIEIGVIALFGFVMALGVSYISADQISNWLVKTQLLGSSVEQDIYTFQYGIYNLVTLEDIASQFNIGLNMQVVLKMFGMQLLIVLASALVPMVIISSYKPREIIAD